MQALQLQDRNVELSEQLEAQQAAAEGSLELEAQLLAVTELANSRAAELADMRSKVQQQQQRLQQVSGGEGGCLVGACTQAMGAVNRVM